MTNDDFPILGTSIKNLKLCQKIRLPARHVSFSLLFGFEFTLTQLSISRYLAGFFFPKFVKSLTVRVQVMASKNDLFSIIYIRNLLLQWKSFIASRNSSVIHMQGKLMKNRPVIRKISYPMWFLHIVLLAVVLPRRDSNRYSSWYWYLETRLIAKTFSISGVPVSPAVLIYRVIRRVFYKYVLPCLFI